MGKKKKKRGKKRKEKGSMSEQEKPTEPEPTEFGPEVMQRRAEELRAMALQSKEQREQQLAAASGAADMINPSDEMDVEGEGEKEKEQEKEKEKEKEKLAAQEEKPETRASEAAEETESSSSYSSDSSDKPAAEEEKPETRASGAQNLDVVPREKEEAPEISVVPREGEEANEEEDDEEEQRAAAMKRFDESFIEELKPLGTKVRNDKHCTSRTISGLLNTLMAVLCEPSELDTRSLKALQSSGELNKETRRSLKAGLDRNLQFQLYLKDKEERLKKEREDYEKAYEMKLNWIRSKVAELNAEKSVTEKGLEYHHDIEDFVVRVFELLKKAQGSEDALAFQWRGLKYDLSREGVEELTKPTLAEGILMDILRTTDTGVTVVQEVETKLIRQSLLRSLIMKMMKRRSHQATGKRKRKKRKISRQLKCHHRRSSQRQLEKKKILQLRRCQRQSGCQSSRRRTRKEKTPAS